MRLLLVLLMLLLGCAQEQVVSPEEKFVVSEYSEGDVTFRVGVSKTTITVAENLKLFFEIESPEGRDLRLPEVGEKLDQFGIVDFVTEPLELTDIGKVKKRRSYVLAPFLSGQYVVPSQVITDSAGNAAVTSDAIYISVDSVLPQSGGEQEIQDIVPPGELRREWGNFALIALMALLLLIIAFLLWRLKKGKQGKGEPVDFRKPHEIAYEELDALVQAGLIAKGSYKEYYYRLSGILREYIERRFQLHAPERTTEEFLREVRGTEILQGEEAGILSRFLSHCDQVKFAKYKPTSDEADKALGTCKAFVDNTIEKEEVTDAV